MAFWKGVSYCRRWPHHFSLNVFAKRNSGQKQLQSSVHQGWMGTLAWEVTVFWLPVKFLTRKLFLESASILLSRNLLHSLSNKCCLSMFYCSANQGKFRWHFMKTFTFLLLLQPQRKPRLWFSGDFASFVNTFWQCFYHLLMETFFKELLRSDK